VLALVLLTKGDGRPDVVPIAGDEEIAARLTLTPRILQFGDTLTANVDVTINNRRIDPASVRVTQEFAPWQRVGKARRTRSDSGATSLVRTSYTLRCIISPCVPPRETAPLEFNASRVAFRRVDGRPAEPLEVQWPVLVVHSNLVASDLDRREAVAAPWKADLVSFPGASYAISPTLLRWLLIAGAVLFAVAGAALVFLAVPRKEPEVEPEPEPEPEPDISTRARAHAAHRRRARERRRRPAPGARARGGGDGSGG
jgi:hypothetical protein